MAEQQIGLIQEADGASRASRESGYWGDDYTEMLMGLGQIEALVDVLVSAIENAMNSFNELYPGVALFASLADDTLLTLSHMIQEKADRIKTLLKKHELILTELPIH